jgi:site-specific recombinase XerD
MQPFTRSIVRQLPIVSTYRECLAEDDRSLKPTTVGTYLANVSSFVMELGKAMNVHRVATEREREALVLATSHRWSLLKRFRNSTLTARLLTVSRNEVCDVLSLSSRSRNVQSMASFCSSVGRFYQWLESSDLLEENHFEAVRNRLEFRWRTLRDSIEHSRR